MTYNSIGTIQGIKESIVSVLRSDPKLVKYPIYESESFINPKTRLPAISIQRLERKRSDLADMSAGHRTYKLPFRIVAYTEPTQKRKILPELYDMEETIESAIENAYHNDQFHESVETVKFVRSHEETIFNMEKNKIFSNTVIMEYDFIYEVMI